MDLGFSAINDTKVGYYLRGRQNPVGGGFGPSYTLEELTFKEFIPPYALGAKDYAAVHAILTASLQRNVMQQDTVVGGRRSVMLDVLANATLDREATRNSMQLIQEHYLNK